MGDRSLLARFGYALTGIATAFRRERNLKVHGCVGLIVLIAAGIVGLTISDWMLLVLLIAVVIGFELMNTAIERAVDLVTLEHHPLAKQAKDIAAGAVLVVAIASAIIGLLIFSKYLF